MESQKQISFVLLMIEQCDGMLKCKPMKNKQFNYSALYMIYEFLVKVLKREHLELLKELLQLVVRNYSKHDSLCINISGVFQLVELSVTESCIIMMIMLCIC